MSEYQEVILRAVDRPLDKKQLEYAQQQSSHAEITRWSFSVEYNYGSFRGDANGLLRHGYDVYLNYSNFGDREIKLHLPGGRPFPKDVWKKYVDGERLQWTGDSKGSGGILTLSPYIEIDGADPLWEFDEHVDAAVEVRKQLISGDLRALYLLWLCAAFDDNYDFEEVIEPPVPHGIAEAIKYGEEFLSFYEIDPLVLVAAGKGVEGAPADQTQDGEINWIKALDNQTAKDLLLQFVQGDPLEVKARILTQIRDSQTADVWPTTEKQRTLEELLQAGRELRIKEDAKEKTRSQAKAKREAAKAERERADRMEKMREDPDHWLREVQRLVEAKGVPNYEAAAEILYDLREAVGGEKGAKIASKQAKTLASKYSTRKMLKSAFKKRGLLG